MADRGEYRKQLAEIDRQGWHLLTVSLVITVALVVGIAVFFYPALEWQVDFIETRHSILPQLVFGLLTLVFLAGAHVVVKQRELNEMRNLIVATYADTGVSGEAQPLDPLTGVVDRRALPEILKHESSRARREQSHLCLVLSDIREFRKINESEGHLAGDLVLKDVAHALKQTARQADSVLRYGPDEFLCFLPGADLAGGQAFVQRVLKACEESSRLRAVTLVFSLAIYQAGSDPEAAIADAERNLKAIRSPAATTPSSEDPASRPS